MKLFVKSGFYMSQTLLTNIPRFFLARLAFAVRAPGYDTNRFSIVYINDYFHLKIDIRHVIMTCLDLSLSPRKGYCQVAKRYIINPSILLYNGFRSSN